MASGPDNLLALPRRSLNQSRCRTTKAGVVQRDPLVGEAHQGRGVVLTRLLCHASRLRHLGIGRTHTGTRY